MATFFEGFADEFFFAVASIVSILVFLDWLLGEEKRAAIREWVGSAWLHLGEARYGEIFLEDIQYVRSLALLVFGTPAFSMNRLLRVTAFILIVLICLLAFFFFWLPRELSYSEVCWDQILSNSAAPCPPVKVDVNFTDILRPVLLSIPTWIISLFFSVSFTIFCMKRLYSPGSSLKKMFFFLLDILLSMALVLSQWIFYLINHTYFIDFGDANPDKAVRELLGYVSLVLICLPTATYLAYLIIRFILKLGKPLVFPPVMLILLRFHQSKKGVLTNLAIFLGGFAKLGQQFAKTIIY
ncbi:hypothetical protein [Ruegeria sp. HKCCA6707]|uniref:hypothetical protein n=1 Tax=Ruegeria sp. HKCCA6707 TaxID=2682996 RepID=UPI001487BC50|nr:hypothetical protein [Ruegeria sp. HKCCA6707]